MSVHSLARSDPAKFATKGFFSNLWIGLSLILLCLPVAVLADIDRLGVYAKLKSVEATIVSGEVASEIDAMAQTIGFGSVGRTTTNVTLRPDISYNSNINGGNPAKPLEVGGLVFNGDPALFRKEGMVYGLNTALSARAIYDHGRYLDATLRLGYAQSIEHQIGILSGTLDICSVNHLKNWWYLDLCAKLGMTERELQNSRTINQTVSISKFLGSSPEAYSKLSLGLKQSNSGTYEQTQLVLDLDTIFQNGKAASVGLVLGESVTGTLATTFSVSADYSTRLANRPIRYAATFRQDTGGLVLGYPREDNSLSVSASLPIWRNINASIGFTATDSSIDHFDAASPVIGLGFASLF